ncbi:MAG: glycosyltransferase [Desulfuromonadales bacterium]|nr:glycosyltransferase [Desulfuromonadales bacterium]
MKKILYATSTLGRSGPTNQLYNVVKYLDRQQFEPHIVTLSAEPQGSRWGDFDSLGVNLHSLGLSRIQGVFWGKIRLQQLIDLIQPDLIHSQGIRADSLIAKMNPEVPWFITSHNNPRHDYPMKFGRLKGRFMACWHLSVMKKSHHVVACSRTIAESLAGHGIGAFPIQNGVELPAGSFENIARLPAMEKPVFISVGSLIPRKNMALVIEAFHHYSCHHKGSLVVLGDGPQMEALASVSPDRVHFFGNVTNVEDYLAIADCFISASLSEGLPNSVLEALAAGVPVILSDIPSHLEVFRECTGSCEVFSLDGGVTALAAKMTDLSSLFSSESKAEAQRVASSVFSAKVMSQHYQENYLNVLDDR